MLLYRAFDWAMPQIAHMVLLLGTDRKKLSKRHGSTSLQEFRDNGILPEALLNYLAIIGWSWDDKTEIFSSEELIEKFDLDRVKASSAIFDHQKLEWMNGHYINHILTLDDLTARALPFLRAAGMVDPAATQPAPRLRLCQGRAGAGEGADQAPERGAGDDRLLLHPGGRLHARRAGSRASRS